MPKGLVSEKSKIESASLSKISLSAYGVTTSSVLIILSCRDAPLSEPTIVSPTSNDPVTTLISRTPVEESQVFTTPVVELIDPVTVSLNIKSPVLTKFGSLIVIVGVITYFAPLSVNLIEVTIPAELITDVPLAAVSYTHLTLPTNREV